MDAVRLDVEGWEGIAESLRNMARRRLPEGNYQGLECDVGFIARVLQRLGDEVFAAKLVPIVGPTFTPTPRFNEGDRVRTLCDEAVWNANHYKKGSEGTAANPCSGGCGYIAVRFSDGALQFVREDQLELVPEEPKPPYAKGDCLRLGSADELHILKTHPRLSADGKKWLFDSTTGFREARACYADVEGETSWKLIERAAGPNHPREDC